MIGRVIVMEPVQYQRWLSGDGGGGVAAVRGEAPETAGARLFQQQRCQTCHVAEGVGTGPTLQGLFGKAVLLQDGETVIADESYIRESILNPAAKVVAGYYPIMPTYQGQIDEEGLMQLLAYIKSLGHSEEMRGER
jgi:cytochrome c oxidase subunit 2